jgi:hypothetical protein
LEPEPFGDALLDPADQNGGRVDPFHAERLIGGEQRDPLVGQFAFQFQRVIHAAGGALNILTHHKREIGRRGFCLIQQIGDAAVTRDPGGGGGLPGVPVAPVFQVAAARFDVRARDFGLTCAAHPSTAPAAPAWYLPSPQQTAPAGPAIAPGPELWHKTTHEATEQLTTGSLAAAARLAAWSGGHEPQAHDR